MANISDYIASFFEPYKKTLNVTICLPFYIHDRVELQFCISLKLRRKSTLKDNSYWCVLGYSLWTFDLTRMIYLKFLLPAISSPVQILTDRQVDGSFFVNKTKSCLLCQNKTHPNAGGDRCVFCTQFFAVNGNCECNKDKLTGGVCLKSEPTGRE